MSASAARPVLALLGLRCSGKTTVGGLLARDLARPFVDQDAETLRFARQSGWRVATVGELLTAAGEARFRELEAVVLRRLLEPCPDLVLATGGGVVERADNRAWLARTARCVLLVVPTELLRQRLAEDPSARPALRGGDAGAELAELWARREPLYRSVAEVVIECGDAAPPEIVRRVRAALEPPARGAASTAG